MREVLVGLALDLKEGIDWWLVGWNPVSITDGGDPVRCLHNAALSLTPSS